MSRRSLYFLLFAISGFSGLIYESIWTHYLKLFLGHAAYSQTLVLAIFMGGMALGSWICSQYSSRWKNLLLGYALTEGIIGLCALVFHNAFAYLIELSYTSILPQLGHPAMVSAFKWTLSALMILPQSILLGMTFPLMSAGILRLFPERPGRSVAMLYFTNSIGAAIGVLVSGFVLIRFTGLPGTIRIAGLINIALALTVWLLVRKSGQQEARLEGIQEAVSKDFHPGWYWFLLFVSLVTGASSFMYEIGWIRMLSLVLGSSTHAFELMLSAFILGLAFGGLWIQRRIDQVASPVRYLAWVQLIMGLLALSTLLLYGNTFVVMQWMVKTLSKTNTGYALFNLSSSGIAMAIMIPTTFCAGMTLPLITFTLIKQGYGERSIGAVYAANTVGAILGVLFAIHLGMPSLGLKGLITFGAGLDMVLGMALFWYIAADLKNHRLPASVTVIGICAIALTLLFVNLDPFKMGSGVYRQGTFSTPQNHRLLYHKDGKTATVSCFLNHSGMLSIRTNGKPDAAIMAKGIEPAADEYTTILLGVIPMILYPQARTAASIGLGSGVTSHMLLCNPRIERLDTVEIEERMVEAANQFRPRVELVYTDPRSRIYIDDAKTFFSTHNKKYDLIVSEPSNPWVSGVGGLFSGEFYRLIGRHMNEGGLFVQWLQLYEIDEPLVISVLKAISAHFSDFVIYGTNRADMMIIAKKNGSVPEPDYSVLEVPGIAEALRRVCVKGKQDIEIRKVGNKIFWGAFVEASSTLPNSDYYPILDQNAARTRFLGSSAQIILNFPHIPIPAFEMLGSSEFRTEPTKVTPTIHFDKSQEAVAAMGLRDYFISGNFAFPALLGDLGRKAALLKQARGGTFPLSENERLGIVFNLSVAMIPYLTSSELEPFWKVLESGVCATLPGSSPERQWYNLFKAVGRRDGDGMLEGAKAILANNPDMTPLARRYLLAAGMVGALANGDRGTSQRLWSKYRDITFGETEPDLLFQLLAAKSRAH